jgi:hypothetical protein
MKVPTIILATVAVLNTLTAGGQIARRSPFDRNPCPGGIRTTGILETVVVASLDDLIYASDLIIVGDVVNVLPAFATSPDHPETVETDSLVSVRESLRGTLPPGVRTIALFQLGGKVGDCGFIIDGDPLVSFGEEYVLFLWRDNRTAVPNKSGSPRYAAVGAWSGKAKVVNNKIHFLPHASAGLHKNDNMDLNDFTALVKDLMFRLRILLPPK